MKTKLLNVIGLVIFLISQTSWGYCHRTHHYRHYYRPCCYHNYKSERSCHHPFIYRRVCRTRMYPPPPSDADPIYYSENYGCNTCQARPHYYSGDYACNASGYSHCGCSSGGSPCCHYVYVLDAIEASFWGPLTDCNCVDPECRSCNPCLCRAKCCEAFGNIGAYDDLFIDCNCEY